MTEIFFFKLQILTYLLFTNRGKLSLKIQSHFVPVKKLNSNLYFVFMFCKAEGCTTYMAVALLSIVKIKLHMYV